MIITVVGSSYVGLVSGVCLAEKGHSVICIDNNSEKVKSINNGVSPIHEDGLDSLLNKHIGKNLVASDDLPAAIKKSDVSLIAVGTPFDGNEIDLSYIKEVSKKIGECLKFQENYHVVVVKSTVVPGTSDEVVKPLLEQYSNKLAGVDFGLGMNPEFLREGVAILDFMNPDRIVLGGIDDKTHNLMEKIYKPFGEVDTILTNNKTAEMIKYTSNSLLATMISFSNEIGNLCSAISEVDSKEVMLGVHLDKRISPIMDDGTRVSPEITTYLQSGCGFGGSCLPKDVEALISHGDGANNSMSLLKSVMEVNKKQPMKVLERLSKHYPNISGMNITVLGLAFKPGTDDMRQSPSIPIINKIIDLGGLISAYDPVAENQARQVFANKHITYFKSLKDSIKNSEVILLLTSWPEFKSLPLLIKSLKKEPLVIDGRGMLIKDDIARYERLGS
jgi:UDPglucose 6-dehydrogenase